MDQEIRKSFEQAIAENIVGVIISNSTNKEISTKVKIRPVLLKEELYYQTSEYKGKQIFHSNYTGEELLNQLVHWFDGLYRQAEITTDKRKIIILISKKGKVTITQKKRMDENISSSTNKGSKGEVSLSHNKKKNYILQENAALPFMVDLGVMTEDGTIVKAKMDKFRQINRFLEYVEDVLPSLNKEKELTILDFGCGKSYLTFALYYYLKILKGYQIRIIGLDLKAEVIKQCNSLSVKYGYVSLKFLVGDIASYEEVHTGM